ncbi:MAG: DNA polymerase I [Chloroflexi bacterium]|nr:DNA polymerase I [Chloroflexota bacterium]
MPARPLFYIVDGHGIAYRQYHALQVSAFSTSQGEPTNATYGFARTLLDILQKDKPDYLAVSFDMGLSGRETLYGEYKGTREKMPDDLSRQIERIYQLVQAFNIPILAYEGYEADDIIGTVAAQADPQNIDVRIVTGDRDMLQLLNDHVTVKLFFPQKGVSDVIYDVARFREEYGGLEPHQLVDLKALMGDSSDNIPGVDGIGKTGALKLIQTYGSIENLYDHLDEMKGSQAQKLAAGRESAFLSKTLATIRRDAPVALDLKNCVAHDYDATKVDELFRELEFNSLRNRLPKTEQLPLFASADSGAESVPVDENICETIIVRDQPTLDALVNTLNSAAAIAFDTETTATDRMVAELVGISLAVNGDTGYYIPVGHQDGQQLPLQTVLDALRPAFTNPAIPKYAHNAEYDLVMMQRYGVDVTPITFDTMIAEWLRRPDSDTLGLKRLALQELNVRMTEITELIGTGKKQVTMNTVPIEKCAPYAAADAAITFRLVDRLRTALEQEQLIKLFEELEMPLVPVIAAIERAGVVLDVAYLRQLGEELSQRLTAVESEIHALSGGYGSFNINSPKQLNDVLFGKLGLPTEGLRKTTHGFSTDAAVLDSLRGAHPIVEKILEYREITKLKGTYVDALPELINPHTGRVHTDFNQTGAATGRLSSSNPNLQNIPNRTEEGRKIRRAFVAPPGMKLLSVDYSQIELRILAHVSQDATLLEAFHQGQDIHAATAAVIYGVPLDQVTKEQRTLAKRINFGLIYGMGAHRLARESNLTFAEAERFIQTYFDRLPGVLRYLESTKRQARTKEGLSTLFGRRRFFPLLFQHYTLGNRINMQVVQAEERVAINFPIQGSAADIIKRAMIDIYRDLNERQSDAHMILQVHDELVFEVPDSELVDTAEQVVRIMESACTLDAPLRANAQTGGNWCDMEAV